MSPKGQNLHSLYRLTTFNSGQASDFCKSIYYSEDKGKEFPGISLSYHCCATSCVNHISRNNQIIDDKKLEISSQAHLIY